MSTSWSTAFRGAIRTFRRRPGFFAVAVCSLGIALGLATAVIAQIDALLHPQTAIRAPEQIYSIQLNGVGARGGPQPTSADVVAALRASPLFADVSAVSFIVGTLDVGTLVDHAYVMAASPDYVALLGVRPQLGRLLSTSDASGPDVALVSSSYWRRYYQNRTSLDGASLVLNDRTYRIVGVLPDVGRLSEVVVPAQPGRALVAAYYARVPRGTTAAQVDTAATVVAAQLVDRFGVGSRRMFLRTYSLKPNPLSLGSFHRALIGAAAFVLLIACANVSALMLARSVTARRDQALRMALGASRADLLRGVTAEVTLLVAVGAVGGVMIAYWATRIMIAVMPPQLAWMGFVEPQWSPRVFGGLLIAVVLSIGLAALLPAWFAMRVQPAEPLKDASATTTGRPAKRFQLLVVGELALAMLLVLGAALVARTAARLTQYDFGYDARSLVQIRTGVSVAAQRRTPAPSDTAAVRRSRLQIVHRDLEPLVDHVRATPGVRDAAWFANDAAERGVVLSDATVSVDSLLFMPQILNVGPGFFRTLGLPIVAGRDFTHGDLDIGAVILDQAGAARLFPGGRAVDGMVKLGTETTPDPWMRVVGITRNAVHSYSGHAEIDPEPVIYVTRAKALPFDARIVVRAQRGTGDVTPVVMRAVRDAVPPGAAVSSRKWLATYDELFESRRFVAGVFATLSLASLVLATAGLFGVLSYAVSQRMREFAVRVALGATTPNIVRLVMRDGLVMALGGTAVGGVAGLLVGFVYQWRWQVSAVDASALIIAEIVLLSVTLAAASGPALRAARANPVDVMRST